MKKYVELELNVLVMDLEDVVTASVDELAQNDNLTQDIVWGEIWQ